MAQAPFRRNAEITDAQLNRNLALEVVRVTEASALAAAAWIGRGDAQAADEAAIGAMRDALNTLVMDGIIANGEGESPSLPLHSGEKVGTGTGPKVDIALFALEGRTACAKGGHHALSMVALTEGGGFLKVPADTYMDKIAAGPGLPPGILDLDRPVEQTLGLVADAKGVAVGEIKVCVLDRPRNADLIGRLNEAGARVVLIDDGDVSGVIAAGLPETDIDMYMGSGGATQSVLAAAGLKCLGGQMQCRFLVRSEEERARCHKAGITDLAVKYDLDGLVNGEVMLAATGVTDGHLLKGVTTSGRHSMCHSLVMRSLTGTLRWLSARHDMTRFAEIRKNRQSSRLGA
jgi:fructose-1,6-bisphosphatase II / sedoheptulose-1,7-bisphosphatase